ncbi:ribonuclease P protein subunit p25-like protein [Macrosteles quadrilineatus]|uniref:ribonuclease P protein subunit p25-like protein n=1 Tax=Macrosteles quadrilineatus TaxID=74068 RepID=UPI0023E1AC5E|nr:ribonuclease P protein subunit p25-like protein [Macrosteles quadrilineatus]XP_054288083.1 ribonuclease P protein subunit p25-like protein [Macrosteles quadrilineatus]
MDKYKKGRNEEEPWEKHLIPISNLPEDFLWMHVNPGTKMRNVLDYAIAEMKTRRVVVWSGSGAAVGKVISCVEIIKRHHTFHQVNRICFRKVKEYWDPLIEDLDPLVVTRDLPTIHILLSKDPVDTSQPGYQGPLADLNQKRDTPRHQNKPQRRRIDGDKFESFGLRSNRTKTQKRKDREPERKERGPRRDQDVEKRDKRVENKLNEPESRNNHKKETNTLTAGPSDVG